MTRYVLGLATRRSKCSEIRPWRIGAQGGRSAPIKGHHKNAQETRDDGAAKHAPSLIEAGGKEKRKLAGALLGGKQTHEMRQGQTSLRTG